MGNCMHFNSIICVLNRWFWCKDVVHTPVVLNLSCDSSQFMLNPLWKGQGFRFICTIQKAGWEKFSSIRWQEIHCKQYHCSCRFSDVLFDPEPFFYQLRCHGEIRNPEQILTLDSSRHTVEQQAEPLSICKYKSLLLANEKTHQLFVCCVLFVCL